MQTRVLGLGFRAAILDGVRDLLHRTDPLARADSHEDRSGAGHGRPFLVRELPSGGLAWDHLDHFSNHIYRRWILNSCFYSLVATRSPFSRHPGRLRARARQFPGRKLILSLTLISMIMPAAALVLPIFLELNATART